MSDVSAFLNEASVAQKQLIDQSRSLATKWEKSGLLEGLKGHEKTGMSVLLENQAGQLLNETSYTNTAGTSGENWAGVALPLVRKVIGQIASKNWVSVQPMNLPAGLVFYMDFKYGTAQGGRSSGESVYGETSGSGTLPRNGLYGAGRFGYTVNDQNVTGLTVNTSSRKITQEDVNFSGIATSSLALYEVSVSSLTRPDLGAVRSFIPSGSVVDFATNYLPEYTTLSGSNSIIVFVAPAGTGGAGVIQSVNYSRQPTDSTRGDFEDTVGDGTDIGIPQIDLELRSEPIVAKTRKLKAVWSPELAQDLNAYHSIDAEAELTAMLSDHIATEIDLEILDMLLVNAQTTEFWSARVGYVWSESTRSFSASAFTGTAWTNMTWFQTLGQKMQKVSNKIHQLTLRGGANFAVVSPTVATILETIPGFLADTDGLKMEFAAGVTRIGSFQNRYTVYKNPYMLENQILMGFRGANFLETGAVYAPYIPLIMTPLVYDPTNFTPRRGVMTRYAKKIVRPEFFGRVIVEGLDTV